ncbi:Oxidoreductase, short chain dehydrogenase/reductase family protein [Aphelenchoides fujianensis]|nr:Oxidoreductase, short chain dehydrogenase/reductase family protein [Aphelenchoides fujianensis]
MATQLVNLSGKTALITGKSLLPSILFHSSNSGASSGIGWATSLLFKRLGASLLVTGRNEERLRALVGELEKIDTQGQIHSVAADLAKEEDVKRIADEVKQKYGRLDVLVNNAGILEAGTIENTPLDSYDRVMNVNLRSVFLLTQLVVPLLEQTKGAVVNVSSVNGIRSFAGVLAYNISKAGLDQLTRCVALELAPKGIRVNSVNPGVTVTELHARSGMDAERYAAFLERSKETHPMGRAGEADECAAAIAFLASSAASFTTGTSLPREMSDQQPPPSSSAAGVRAEFVENARRFFRNPKIRSTPLDEQKAFLRTKGVTDAEIAAALESIPASEGEFSPLLSANQTVEYTPHHVAPPPPPQRTVTSVAQSVLVVGGAAYMTYRFVRTWVLPRFFDVVDPEEAERRALRTQLNELQNTTKFIMDSVNQTLETVATQQEQLNRALGAIANGGAKENELQRLNTDVSVIKSLLLRGDQFPRRKPNGAELGRATKSAANFTTEIPAWQLQQQQQQQNGEDAFESADEADAAGGDGEKAADIPARTSAE